MKKKIAFVLGGSGLLGKSIVSRLTKEKIKVVVLDIKKPNFYNLKSVFFFKFDLKDIQNLNQNLNFVCKRFGCPDYFINTAYPYYDGWSKIRFENLKLEDLRKNIDIHLNSFAWSTLKITEIMKKNKKKGSIVLINSIYGVLAQDKNLYKGTKMYPNPLYSIIKSGLIGMVKNASSYYGDFGIRINSIVSGGIEGPIANSKKNQSKIFKSNYIKRTPLRRMGQPKDVAGAVLFLCSKESSYITGSNIHVDGGWSII
tara:strand:+ start:136 stop:903 length:768 start_codon:yes stop_codon:yes gene_type:complete